MPKPTVSVVIPTYNGAGRISECLDALVSQKTTRDYEIIVVDDGSADNTSDIVKGNDGVRLIRQKNAGPAAARNHGVEKSFGEIILFVDDDCLVEANWLENMLAPFEDPEIAGVKGAYLTKQTELTAKFVQIEYEEKYDELRKHRHIDFIDTYSAGFRRDVFLSAGGYDTDFPTASVEDQEFSFRLANQGHKMVFNPEARVWHTHVDTFVGYLKKKMKIGYWKVKIFAKDPGKMAGDSHTPLTLKIQILLAVAAFLFPALFGAGLVGVQYLGVVAVLFLITAFPLTFRSFKKETLIGLMAPVFIGCRAAGLTAGLIWGVTDNLILRKPISLLK